MLAHLLRRFALVFVTLFAASVALGAEHTVTNNADTGDGSLRAALVATVDGDSIVFALPAGSEKITLTSGELSISDKSLSIDGSNPMATGGSGMAVTITVPSPGNSSFRVFNLGPGAGHTVTLRHLTLCGGNVGTGKNGGVISCSTDAIELDSVTVRDGRAYTGGGLYIPSGVKAALKHCMVSGNTTLEGGVGGGLCVNTGGEVTLTNSTVRGNTAYDGGGLYVNAGGTATLTSCTVKDNSASGDYGSGGGLCVSGTVTLTNSTVSDNSAAYNGGGLSVNAGGTATLTNCTVGGNRAPSMGGGLTVSSGATATLLNSLVVANSTSLGSDLGPDLRNAGTLRAYGCWYGSANGTITADGKAPNEPAVYTADDLALLADNGGLTETRALAATAPAVGKGIAVYYNVANGHYLRAGDGSYYQVSADGTLSAPSFTPSEADRISADQRGVARGALPDIGAYQLVRFTTVDTPVARSYRAGSVLTFIFHTNSPVSVTSAPSLALTIGGETRQMTYDSAASTSTQLVFRYTVAAGDTDTDGISAGGITPAGSILDSAGVPIALTLPNFTLPTIIVDTTAPDTTITAQPANPSTSASATFTFAGEDGTGTGVVRFEASLDGASYATVSSPHTLTGLADGSHTWGVRAVDAVGNADASPASYGWTVDTTAPGSPTVTSTVPTGTTANPSHTLAGTAEAGATVKVYNGATLLGTTTAGDDGQWSLALTLSDGVFSVSVTASDAAGNTSTSTVAGTWTVDTTAPATPVVTVVALSTITGYAEPGSTVQVLVDGAGAGTTTADGTTGAWTYAFSDELAAGSIHTFTAVASDAAGNASAASSALTLTISASGATWLVTSNTDQTTAPAAGLLRYAVDHAASGDTIVFALAAGNETITIADELSISGKSLSIDGSNPMATGGSGTAVTIQVQTPGSSGYRVFYLNLGAGRIVTLRHLTLRGGVVGEGGVICCADGALSLDTVTLRDGRANMGGGLYVGGTATLTNSTVSGNTASNRGGGLCVGGTATLTNSTVSGNTADYGGGLCVDGTATLTNSTVSGNTADYGGGLCVDGTAALTNSTVSGNTAINRGGGLYVRDTATLLNSLVVANTAHLDADLCNAGTLNAYGCWYGSASGRVTGDAAFPNVTTVYTADALAALADNGGPTQTHALAATAPAVGKGISVYYNATDGYYLRAGSGGYYKVSAHGTLSAISSLPAEAVLIERDQRGVSRGASPDIGAWQLVRLTTVDTLAAGSYKAGSVLSFTVHTNSPVNVTGEPRLALTIGAETRQAAYTSGSGTTALVFLYTVGAGDTDTDGIEVGPAIDLNGGTLVDGAGKPIALTLRSYTLPMVKVDTTAPAAPVVSIMGRSTVTGYAEPGCTVQVLVDGTVVGMPTADPSTGAWTYTPVTPLATGSAHTFTAVASDAAGNASAGSSALTIAVPTSGSTWPVTLATDQTTTPAAGTLRYAVNHAADGDSIVFALPAGSETIMIQSELSIADKSLTIDGRNEMATGGSGTRVTITVPVPGSSTTGTPSPFRVFNLAPGADHTVTLRHLTLCGGRLTGAVGGVVYSGSGALSLDAVAMYDGAAVAGGGLAVVGAVAATLTNCTVSGNTATSFGGGLYTHSTTTTLANCLVSGNRVAASGSGGGLYVSLSTATLTNCTVSNNMAPSTGGGIWALGDAMLVNCTVTGNSASVGGGLYAVDARTTLLNSLVIANSASSGADLCIRTIALFAYGSCYEFVDGTITESETFPNQPDGWPIEALALLDDNGGPTLTFALTGSPEPTVGVGLSVYYNVAGKYHYLRANDGRYYQVSGATGLSATAFTPANPEADLISTDQRGVTRGALPDIGAYQLVRLATVDTPAAGSYKAGSVLTFTIHTNSPVSLTGAPRLVLTLGSAMRQAVYDSAASTSTQLVFHYTVAAGETDTDGIDVGLAIDLNGGTLVDGVGASIALTLPSYTRPMITVDTSAPSVPTIGSITSTSVSGTAEAGSRVEVFNGSTSLGTATADGSGNWSLRVTLADGACSLTATSGDAAGNRTSTPGATVRMVDAKVPTLASVTLASSNATPTQAKAGDTVRLTFVASEALQMPTVTLAGESAPAAYDNATGTWGATHTVAAVDTEGVVIFSISFSDVAANAGTVATATSDDSAVTIDLTAPETVLVETPASLSTRRTATFTFSSADGMASYEASLDSGPYAAVGSPCTLNGLADGEHTFAVRAFDAAGNMDATPAIYTWAVDATAPETPEAPEVESGTNRPVISGAAEAGSTVTVYVNGVAVGTVAVGGSGAWAYPIADTWSDGEHTVTYTVADAAGNVSVLSAPKVIQVSTASRFAALSARGPVGTGEQTLTLGFVFGGSGSKATLVRGVGPGISATVPGAVADPSLSLFNYTAGGWSAVGSNDDWAGAAALRTAFAATGAGALADGSKDAALLATLPDRIYTAQVTAAGSGVVLAETYDVALGDRSRWLTALSVRNQVGTGAETLIAGFVIDGTQPKAVIVRAVGPGLSPSVANYLANPEIRLWRLVGGAWTLVDSNDDWSGSATDAATFAAVGMGALTAGSKDAALLLTLEPGIYTVQVTGVGGTTGVALTEIYEAP